MPLCYDLRYRLTIAPWLVGLGLLCPRNRRKSHLLRRSIPSGFWGAADTVSALAALLLLTLSGPSCCAASRVEDQQFAGQPEPQLGANLNGTGLSPRPTGFNGLAE
jgi:hypothetical protein